jgi:MauM/NapG family ferredoxin protein
MRRFVQGATFVLFLILLWMTRDVGGEAPRRWLTLFFAIDPLVLLATWLASHTLAGLSLLALITVGLTLLLGRVFCGWICPFGTLHNIVTWMRARKRDGRLVWYAFSKWQRAKFFLLFALIVMALVGVHWIGVFDPASIFYRSVATALLPVSQHAIEESTTTIYDEDPHIGSFHFTSITEPIYEFFRDQVFVGSRPVFVGSGIILLIFLAAIILNLYRPRFWCRYVCPLGALLGLLAKRTTLRLGGTAVECTECKLCTMACPAAAQPEKQGEWLPSECFGCWNCVSSCQRGGLDFRFAWPWQRPKASSVNLSRRSTIAALLGGVGGSLLLRVAPQAQARSYHPLLIRPPGSLPEPEFLQKCIQCGMCMKVCPPNALHPTALEAGLEGIWTPMLVARIGYCDYECNLCGQVCPTHAIEHLPLVEKKKIKIGLAVLDTTRCLPYAFDRECIVCEEHCPIPTKAIYFVETEVPRQDGTTRILKLPRVDAELCTGCGICETKCPFEDLAAIRVTSANEDRHPENQPLLPDAGSDPYSF